MVTQPLISLEPHRVTHKGLRAPVAGISRREFTGH